MSSYDPIPAAGPPIAALAGERAGVPGRPHAGLIIREREPVNLESPFDQLDGLLTPASLFYVRSHFHAPAIARESYCLQVEGAVKQPIKLGLNELLEMPAVTRTATLECAGNGRIFLVPQKQGAQWQLGAVSTAEWTGVPLAALLERAGVVEGACEVLLEGADRGTPKEPPVPPGEIAYSHSLPLAKAAGVLLAYRMNGDDLPRDHGAPLRAVVPGFYGMASVKWLTRVTVLREPFRGYFQTSDYAYWDELAGHPVRVPLGSMALKSAIARPAVREVVSAGSRFRVFGAAWGGEAPIGKIDVSTDDGVSWGRAQLLDPARPGIWQRWAFDWDVPAEPGIYVLRSRATAADGTTQPSEHDKRFGSYVIHHTLPIEVVVA